LKLGCHILNISTKDIDGPLAKRAKASLRKRETAPKERRFLRSDTLRRLMMVARGEEDQATEMMYLAAYTFMLRVPSEGLPMVNGGCPSEALPDGVHSAVAVSGNELMLRLAKRKNRVHGLLLRRACTCPANRWMCPVHVLGAWLSGQPSGARAFAHLSAGTARANLRRHIALLQVPKAEAHGLHDFRRCHAQDLADAGGELKVILEAGEWSSPAFLKYLDVAQLERDVVVHATMDDSGDSDAS
jgi:hypothetical protein